MNDEITITNDGSKWWRIRIPQKKGAWNFEIEKKQFIELYVVMSNILAGDGLRFKLDSDFRETLEAILTKGK